MAHMSRVRVLGMKQGSRRLSDTNITMEEDSGSGDGADALPAWHHLYLQQHPNRLRLLTRRGGAAGGAAEPVSEPQPERGAGAVARRRRPLVEVQQLQPRQQEVPAVVAPPTC